MAKKVKITSYSKPKETVIPILRDGKVMDPLLWDILHIASPSGEEKLMFPLLPKSPTMIDEKGNHIYLIGRSEEHQTMFSCHLDTMQRDTDKIIPHISKDDYVGGIKVGEKSSSTLGADDKLGVYLMLKMIKQRIPGLYVFHIGEECGGKGSEHLVKTHPELFTHIKRCIAFDRRDITDVITHQRGHTRGCSDEFAKALSEELNKLCKKPAQLFKPCDGGIFTDSANYWHLIPECTNISIGYYDNHCAGEYFDHWFLEFMLLPAVLKLNWYKLPTVRAIDETVRPAYARYSPPAVTTYPSSEYYYNRKRDQYGPYADLNADKGDDLPFYMNGNGGTITNSAKDIAKEAMGNVVNLSTETQKKIRKEFIASCKRISPATPIHEVPIYDPFKHGVLEGLSEIQHKFLIKRQIERQSGFIVAEWIIKYMKHYNGAVELLKQANSERLGFLNNLAHLQNQLAEAKKPGETVIQGEPINKKIIKLRKLKAALLLEVEVKNDELKSLKKAYDDVVKKIERYSNVLECIVQDKGQDYVTEKFINANY